MTLPLGSIRALQETLDARIMVNHQVTRPQTRTKRILALMVEIGELANETRTFKFWSYKAPSEKEVLLEELGDCVHFAVSLGIDLGDQAQTLRFEARPEPLSEQFIAWMAETAALTNDFTLKQYQVVLSYIGSVALAMGFDAKDVSEFYIRKNEINHVRQETNY